MKSLISKYGINEEFTKPTKKIKKFNNIKANMIRIPDTNLMADLLELPKTSKGNKYLLSIVDLADDDCDFEPLKTKTPAEIKKGFEKIFRRPYIKSGKILSTDAGNEFKGEVDQYLKKKKIYHRTSMPGKHTQTANVEALNRQLARILNGYMNKVEVETKRQYNNWDDIIDTLRVDLNEVRHKELPSLEEQIENMPPIHYDDDPKYAIGDMCHYKVTHALSALGHKQSTPNFREGDYRWSKDSLPIQNIFYMRDHPHYRYQLRGLGNVSFYEEELKLSHAKEQTHIIKKVIGKKTEKRVVYYLVWWQGELKKDATWEPAKNLIEDGAKGLLDLYDANPKA